jgi:hypothetical protein
MTAPTATADDLLDAASHVRADEWEMPDWKLADRLEALAARYDLMLEVIAAAEMWEKERRGIPVGGHPARSLEAAVRALREAQ